MLRAEVIAKHLSEGLKDTTEDPFVITPIPDIEKLKVSGAASIDLRLGCWFTALSKTGVPYLDVFSDDHVDLCEEQFINFGDHYILHPHSFVLAVTLEWVRLPKHLAAYIHGKSSWGRRGLVIATASVIHPGFTGCITLELANIGEVPIKIVPGMSISQLCLHDARTEGNDEVDKSTFNGQRKPTIGTVKTDFISSKLQEGLRTRDIAPKI
jgi:dCTP deaminase